MFGCLEDLKVCCCGCSLKTGCLIIGGLVFLQYSIQLASGAGLAEIARDIIQCLFAIGFCYGVWTANYKIVMKYYQWTLLIFVIDLIWSIIRMALVESECEALMLTGFESESEKEILMASCRSTFLIVEVIFLALSFLSIYYAWVIKSYGNSLISNTPAAVPTEETVPVAVAVTSNDVPATEKPFVQTTNDQPTTFDPPQTTFDPPQTTFDPPTTNDPPPVYGANSPG